MKSVLSLACVLVISSLCSAAVVNLTSAGSNSVAVNEGDTVTVDLTLDFACSGLDWINFVTTGGLSIDAPGTWQGDMTDAPLSSGTLTSTGLANSIIEAYSNASSDLPAGTILYTFTLTASDAGTVAPSMSDDDFAFQFSSAGYTGDQLTMAGLEVSIVPEPATIFLLGLGFVCLRKK
jgi:hypothetical protein